LQLLYEKGPKNRKNMKKLILSLAFVALAFGLNAQGNVIKTNPLGLAFGNFNATYERVLGTTSSVLIRDSTCTRFSVKK